eukprot:1158204-Pelagomonas_calceolata.AAC.2
MLTERNLLALNKEEKTHWLKRAVSPLHHTAKEPERLVRIWRVTGSTRLQNLAAISISIFEDVLNGNQHLCFISGS